ncbi:MAG: hypothetical protein UU08_C0033G0004 [Candidatus Uhrbacteria bacterium GW2011_GWE2_40_58]|nr:MAG: hypothetical protein UT94_C0034G0003 [Candidatus Uhrbacteria bacterium GW2011_GWF2_40_263]KKR66800.1 MAG: hypothetical protein UU08_C0033G0004 [Candidatus Uhrbacteria bacterium GW2011_GWE2_40_58]OGL93313.1 MAG: hypothetical protein A2239_01075 [Candidatus Uhrbacteria bacterium RIFOXYA2_FULL_40_9]OGL97109.1 MAG: hypothetical protein A2332_04355 [Candidatus Uhrbacteria bacterium RIFOXYB2_FULL_41_18]HCB55869.1 hypothetical protein [Candidatus Uhrbacteria bacterium]
MKRLSIILSFFLVCFFADINFAHAFSVNPTLIELSGQRGETVLSQLEISNESNQEEIYLLGSLNFVAQDESGAPDFIPYKEDQSGLSNWIVFSTDTIFLPAHTTVQVPYSLVTPDDIPSGSYYCAITVSQTPTEVVESNGVAIQATIASLVFYTVEGDTLQKAELLSFETTDKSLFFSSLPGLFVRLQNQGNVVLIPEGQIKARDIFGRIFASVNINEDFGRILPLSTRKYQIFFINEDQTFFQTIKSQLRHFAIGPVTFSLSLSYGSFDQISDVMKIWYFPWQLFSFFLIVIVFILLFWRILSHFSKKRFR